MNTPVNFELAKLLKEKGFDKPCGKFYCENIHDDDEIIKDNLCQRRDFGIYAIQITNYNFRYEYGGKLVNEGCYSAPTIAEIVMWLYEKHGIWIRVEPDWDGDFWAQIKSKNIPDARIGKWLVVTALAPYKTPTEAYEAAIEYTLKSLI